jgi:hypothetical protein
MDATVLAEPRVDKTIHALSSSNVVAFPLGRVAARMSDRWFDAMIVRHGHRPVSARSATGSCNRGPASGGGHDPRAGNVKGDPDNSSTRMLSRSEREDPAAPCSSPPEQARRSPDPVSNMCSTVSQLSSRPAASASWSWRRRRGQDRHRRSHHPRRFEDRRPCAVRSAQAQVLEVGKRRVVERARSSRS